MRGAFRRWCVAGLAFLSATPAAAQDAVVDRTVAITFDDLPYVHVEPDDAEPQDAATAFKAAETANRRILAALRRYRAPATGFVTETRVQALGERGARLLTPWNRGAFELANHGFSHADANALDAAAIAREIVAGGATIVPMAQRAGRRVTYVRFPYNHLGETADKQAAVMAFLAARGLRLAASTIDTSDYLFDAAFERALRERNRAMQARIKRAYLAHTAVQIDYYAALHRQVLGYEPPQIMLLHLNRLNAATMDEQLALFRKAGYRFVSLDTAQSHPVYADPPRIATRFGPMWAYRWAHDRGVKVDGRLEQEPPAWIADYGAGKSGG